MADHVLLAVLLAPVVLMTGRWFRGRRWERWGAPGSALLVLLFWGPFMRLINGILESPYTQAPPGGDAQAIVLFPGAVMPPEPERPVAVVAGDTYERAFYAAWLYKHQRPLPILACGGPDASSPPYSHIVRRMLTNEGVPEAMIWTEDRSQNTYENALYAAPILRSRNIHRVILVTEAYHMLRAEMCLRKQGIDVVPAPCSFRSRFRFRIDRLVLPSREFFDYSVDGFHELIGLGWYALRGRV